LVIMGKDNNLVRKKRAMYTSPIKILALPQIEWVDYRMGDERQRTIRPDSGDQEPLAGNRC
jgi:hypothetical protein